MNLLKKCKNSIGYRVHNFKRRNHDPDAEFNAVLAHLLQHQKPSDVTILDVGAHHGESIRRFKKLFPDSTIHRFEPGAENFSALTEKAKHLQNVHLNNVGVGAKRGKLEYYHNLKSSTSGFNPINEESEWAKKRSEQRGISVEDYTQKTYEVDIIDLDSYVAEKKLSNISLLKIDTQGHEDAVFDGCKSTLEKGIIDVIETELIVGDAYTKSLTFSDIESRLLPYGYKFYGIDTAGDLFHTPWLSFNLIYVHERLLSD